MKTANRASQFQPICKITSVSTFDLRMHILQSTLDDLETIFQLYDDAIAHQKSVSDLYWLPFDRQLVEIEIAEGRQWKILAEDGQVAGVFVTAYSDPAIWGDQDHAPAVYLHRIVTNSKFRGQNLITRVVDWAKQHGKSLQKKFVRLDTWAANQKLKEIYLRNGFQFLFNAAPADPSALPSHYSGILLGFYEIEID